MGVLSFVRTFAGIRVPFIGEACKTQKDQEGPFYKAGAPDRNVIEKDGIPMQIRGRIIRSSDCQTPVPNAILDIWHCDSNGDYDNDGYKCRGVVKADAAGNYEFTSIFPPSYGRRPRHIHFKVRAAGFPELTSQIYFKGDPNIKNDFARNADSSRVIELTTENNLRVGRFDIYI